MESYSQFTNQYILSVSSLLNAMTKRAANISGFKDMSKTVSWNTTEGYLVAIVSPKFVEGMLLTAIVVLSEVESFASFEPPLTTFNLSVGFPEGRRCIHLFVP